ncbi:4Fe-4S binding protein [Hujiaoplasma nucleasis]|uniref:4Fe-4S binding protein n=1 Tax=Hujiaoplasma nucleasis TaxID=2725268 RepID=A0A7L6N370_9MOLU|nr:monomeric [FeFe] hydrogenase [Hujiaoplasma nucleasis]QLY39991.1 4Fe-4S binding protein [Hujiaoplasma nucleasis]
MRKFDTQVEYIKYKVLKEVATHAWHHQLYDHLLDIPKTINPTRKPISRCCVYKEQAILAERVKLAVGGSRSKHIVEVIDIACDECPVGGYEVTNGCRGCLAHKCQSVCPKNAISFDSHNRAMIDKEKCIECGLCAKVCPYSAIKNNQRPCVAACKVDAIRMDENKVAVIDHERCISCGACVVQCPFGAMVDKSYIIDVIDYIQKKTVQSKVVAIIAPSIASQYHQYMPENIIGALIKLGFDEVVEAAMGADIVSERETEELIDKGFLTSSCCPAFVSLIKKHYPDQVQHISHNLSPMAVVGQLIKKSNPYNKCVFIGPCIAKKGEAKLPNVSPYIDAVLTFEELDALFDSQHIDISACESIAINDASYYGRIFARSGGLIESIQHQVNKKNIEGFKFEPFSCNGIDECKKALIKIKNHVNIGHFIEGMSCVGGCIGGPGSISHSLKDKMKVDTFGKSSKQS